MNLRGRIETPRTTSKPGLPFDSGNSVEATYLPITRCPVFRRRDSDLGFRMELENLVCNGKGKGTSGRTTRPKVPMGKPGADCAVVPMKRHNGRGGKGAGHPRCDRFGELATGGTGGDSGRRQPSMGGTSRVIGDGHARFCEGLGVRFPGATRLREAQGRRREAGSEGSVEQTRGSMNKKRI